MDFIVKSTTTDTDSGRAISGQFSEAHFKGRSARLETAPINFRVKPKVSEVGKPRLPKGE